LPAKVNGKYSPCGFIRRPADKIIGHHINWEENCMKELLITIAQGLVENPETVEVHVDEPTEDGTIVYHLHVGETDMGRVIGKQGRIAKAIRTVMRAAATRKGEKVSVEID